MQSYWPVFRPVLFRCALGTADRTVKSIDLEYEYHVERKVHFHRQDNKVDDTSIEFQEVSELHTDMIGAFEKIRSIAAAAIGQLGDELTFSSPEVLQVISLCTEHAIVVLGLEVFQVLPEGYATRNCSGYSQGMIKGPERVETWSEYIETINVLAKEFVIQNPAGDDHVYVLTTVSWEEFCKIQEIRRAGFDRYAGL